MKPVVLLLPLALALSACTLPGGASQPDPVSGSWAGAWYHAGEKEPAGILRCRLTRIDGETWNVVLEAASQVEVTYEFTITGRYEGSRVLFRDTIDLGRASGGTYEWSGEVNGEIFQGTYRHPAGDGRFELVRRSERESALPPEKELTAPR